MLAREGEPNGTRWTDTMGLEDDTVAIKSLESLINGGETVLVNCWTPDQIVEVEICRKCTNHVVGNMSLDCGDVNLEENLIEQKNAKMRTHLHKRL